MGSNPTCTAFFSMKIEKRAHNEDLHHIYKYVSHSHMLITVLVHDRYCTVGSTPHASSVFCYKNDVVYIYIHVAQCYAVPLMWATVYLSHIMS